eukprot:190862-Amphidinium_carterae.1
MPLRSELPRSLGVGKNKCSWPTLFQSQHVLVMLFTNRIDALCRDHDNMGHLATCRCLCTSGAPKEILHTCFRDELSMNHAFVMCLLLLLTF